MTRDRSLDIMADHWEPEMSLKAFARLHDVQVTLHDAEGLLSQFVPFSRLWHRHGACEAAKRQGQDPACIAFDSHRVAEACPSHPRGLVKVCHAGLKELVLPRFAADGQLRWVLFVGPWRDDGRPVDVRDRAGPVATGGGLRDLPALREMDLLDALRGLSARLAEWVEIAAGTKLGSQTPSRRAEVVRFLRMHYSTPVGLEDVARHLRLSPSRTTHEITRLFGESFITLLVQARLDAAVSLLRQSDLPIAEVATRCGFQAKSNFNKAFRRRFGVTPSAVRRSPESWRPV